jgi:hypothetical protein
VLQPHSGTAIVGVLTFYFVATAWAAATRKQGVGAFEKVAFLVPAGATAALLIFALRAMNSATGEFDDLPPGPYLGFAAFAAFVAAVDLRLVVRGGVSGAQRIARHLWRMCFALSFAAATFFLGQQQVFPTWLQGSPVMFAPVLAPLVLLAYWLVRVRFTGWWRESARL